MTGELAQASFKADFVGYIERQADWNDREAKEHPERNHKSRAEGLHALARFVAALPDDDERLRRLEASRDDEGKFMSVYDELFDAMNEEEKSTRGASASEFGRLDAELWEIHGEMAALLEEVAEALRRDGSRKARGLAARCEALCDRRQKVKVRRMWHGVTSGLLETQRVVGVNEDGSLILEETEEAPTRPRSRRAGRADEPGPHTRGGRTTTP